MQNGLHGQDGFTGILSIQWVAKQQFSVRLSTLTHPAHSICVFFSTDLSPRMISNQLWLNPR
jgi:hypothetical protein